jgi:general nucleoside transport system ATP-binding protein
MTGAVAPSIADGAPPLLRLEGITKVFPGVVATDDVTVELRAGEIHTILGENGAGKTTLMGVAFGLLHADAGRVLIDGREARIRSPRDALAHGIGYVQQHFSLIPTLTVAENLVLALRGDPSRTSVRRGAARVRDLSRQFGIDVDPDARVEDLSVGLQQRAELLKALARDTRILILDEPASVLTPQESSDLSAILRRLAGAGIGIFLISHKLEEVLRVSDRFTILRRGRLVATLPRAEVDRTRLATLMIGELSGRSAHGVARADVSGSARLEARGLSVLGDRGGVAVQAVSFAVRGGEILGVAGVEGSGQVELTECLAGLRSPSAGDVLVDGVVVSGLGARRVRRAGVAHVPADRSLRGVIRSLSVAEGVLLPAIDQPPYSRFGLLRRPSIEAEAVRLIEAFDIRPRAPDALVGSLSGGNQQKVVLAREIRADPAVIVACYPTRGLDFAATEAVERVLVAARERGAAVLYVSTDLDELLALADRVLVLAHGRITGELPAHGATAEQLGLLMGGSAA